MREKGSIPDDLPDEGVAMTPGLRPMDLGMGVLFGLLSEAILVVEQTSCSVALLNPAAEHLFGLGSAEAAGLPLANLLPGNNLKALCSADGGVGMLSGADGQPHLVDIQVAPLETPHAAYRVLVLRDLGTARARELQRAARESEAKLRAIVDKATDGIWIKDLEGRYILINPAGAAIAGRTVDETLGRTDEELYEPRTARRIRELDDRVMATGEGATYEISVATPATGLRTYFSTKYPYVREDGSIQGIVVITRDITERKQLEQDLQEQYERLKELDRLKNDFVNAVSHELRTPLTSIRGYLEFMEDGIGGTLSPQHTEFVAEIDRASNRLARLVDDLLDFARIQAGTFELRYESFDLADKIQELVSSLVPQAEKAHVSLVASAAAPLPMRGDPQRLGQVLLNLAHNAIKFTPGGGSVELVGRPEGGGIRLEVRDTGTGIAPGDLAKLFEKFSQLDAGRSKGGNGLGLSICKAIVEAHGGQIGVESRLGHGSVFWVELPTGPDA